MRINHLIQVFEYEFLAIGKKGFEPHHWVALGKYNEEHEGRFFTLTHNGVRFQQYVGVIQVGNLTIEILPKIGRDTANGGSKADWQQVLIDMLRECNWMKVYAHEKASLRFKYNSILEAYLELFVSECEDLIRQGLIKKYRIENANCNSLKGKLQFAQNLRKNLVHQERFFTSHQVYDRNNVFNQILYKALQIIPLISQSPLLRDRVYGCLLAFPELDDIKVRPVTFENLAFDRKTAPYREAIEIAAMLLLNYRPDISNGHNNILAILFDMNDLWEEYIFRQLKRHCFEGWNITAQRKKDFWKQSKTKRRKIIKPDIVVVAKGKRIIIDTKWKLPDDNIPSDNDLKQMYVYNQYWAGTSILLYPQAIYSTQPDFEKGEFYPVSKPLAYNYGEGVKVEERVSENCGVMKISVLNPEKRLDETIGERINKFLKEKVA
jgi:5-methylcytosine-specific restriction enzyme subunit McrC